MKHPCNHCHGTGLSTSGQAVSEGRARQNEFGYEELFCRRCGGRGATGGVAEWLWTLAVIVASAAAVTAFWGGLFWLLFR